MIMKNEIKEILDKLKDKNNYISHSMILLSIKETAAILDCITNLQEEIKRLNNIINELEKWLNDNENYYDYESKYDYIYVDNILDKLKELKEGKQC